ncbi:MAG: TIGR01620 family protein [Hyphomicrobiaceae bacterium]
MTGSKSPRKPAVFSTDDPDVVLTPEPQPRPDASPETGRPGDDGDAIAGGARDSVGQGIRWGAILITAGGILGSIAIALSYARFVSVALERSDWIGWVAFGLLVVIGISGLAIVLREVLGFLRLRRLGQTRTQAERALREGDLAAERKAVDHIVRPLQHRHELRWGLARLAEEKAQVRDPGDLLCLLERDVIVSVDMEAKRRIAAAARRVATVSAISPTAFLTMGWITVEQLRLLRAIAGLYGGRPGFLATAKLARMVVLHIVATGGVALTDDLLGQFLGQDILRRLSRRLGEGIFNAALVARIGAAAIDVIRPLPYIEAPRIRARDLVPDIARGVRGAAATEDRRERA